jgi:hypothetical protein
MNNDHLYTYHMYKLILSKFRQVFNQNAQNEDLQYPKSSFGNSKGTDFTLWEIPFQTCQIETRKTTKMFTFGHVFHIELGKHLICNVNHIIKLLTKKPCTVNNVTYINNIRKKAYTCKHIFRKDLEFQKCCPWPLKKCVWYRFFPSYSTKCYVGYKENCLFLPYGININMENSNTSSPKIFKTLYQKCHCLSMPHCHLFLNPHLLTIHDHLSISCDTIWPLQLNRIITQP